MFFKISGNKGGEKPKQKAEKFSAHIKHSSELHALNRDTKIASLLKREFKGIAWKEGQGNLRLLFVGIGEKHGVNVAGVTEGWNVPEGYAEFITESKASARFLNAHGINAEKKHAEEYVSEEAADVVIVLDEEVGATNKFIKNVDRKGYLICRGKMATEAMESGKFQQKGVLTLLGGEWRYTESKEYDVVQTDDEFEKAKEVPGAVSYKEAKETLIKLGRPTDNVLEEYQKLIKEAREMEENRTAVDAGETRLTYTASNGQTIEIETGLPRMHVSDDDIYILRKRPDAL